MTERLSISHFNSVKNKEINCYICIKKLNNMESGYYPAGAEYDPRAPYNQCDPEKEDVEVTIYLSLVKDSVIQVDDYIVEEDEEGCEYADTSSCDLEEGYKDSEYTPVQLMDMLREIAEAQLRGETAKVKHPYDVIRSCKGWKTDLIEIECI